MNIIEYILLALLFFAGVFLSKTIIKRLIDFNNIKKNTGVVDGVITKSNFIESYRKSGDGLSYSYKTDIKYKYSLNSKEYTQANVYYDAQVENSEKNLIISLNNRFRVGTKINVYFEIGNEKNAWLINEVRPLEYIILLAGVVLMVFSLIMIFK